MALVSVPARNLDEALSFVRKGGTLLIPTYTHCTYINAKVLARFDAVGSWVLKEDGDGYRMKSGRGSVYLLPGQLKYSL